LKPLHLDPSAISISYGAHYDETCGYSGRCNAYNGGYPIFDLAGTVVHATKVVLYPDYKPNLKHDICLIQVPDMNLDGRKASAAILSARHIDQIMPGDLLNTVNCSIAGWGKTERFGQSPVILSVPEFSNDRIREIYFDFIVWVTKVKN